MFSQPPLEDQTTSIRKGSVTAAYRNIAQKYRPGSSTHGGPASVADAKYLFKVECSNAGLRYEDAASFVVKIVNGTALTALLTYAANNPEHSTEAAFAFLESMFTSTAAYDDTALEIFTTANLVNQVNRLNLFTWNDFLKELVPPVPTEHAKIFSALVLKACACRQSYLLIFTMRRTSSEF